MKPQFKQKSFRSHQGGNVAMIFALSLLPLLLVAGFAIDAQLAFSKKGKIQRAVDSAALAGARMMQSENDAAKVRKHARTYFDAIMQSEFSNLKCDSLGIEFTGEEEIQANVKCYQPTSLMHLVGHDQVEIHTTGTATYGTGRLDISFVFDVSGSMGGARISDLKTAAHDAVDTLLPKPGSASDGDVRIAMAAYNSMVDAGEYFEDVTGLRERRTYEATDVYWEDASSDDPDAEKKWKEVCTAGWGRFCWRWEWQPRWVIVKNQTVEQTITDTCVYERDGEHAFDNRAPKFLKQYDLLKDVESGRYNAREDDDSDNGDAYLTASHLVWNDNEEEKGGHWNYVGVDECSDSDPFALSHNKTQIDRYIDRLGADGGTAGHQGIAWGWYMISDTWSDMFKNNAKPLDKSEPDVVKAMIIMTDGAFNEQFHNDLGNSTDQAEKMCDAIKNDNVIVYTVAFQAPEEGQDVLEYCASGPEFYFNADNGQELVESYRAIATSISDLRISH